MRLRQIALMCRDLEAVVADLGAVFGLELAYRDPGVGVFGLRNALLPVGDAFLEVLTPDAPGSSGGRFLERRGGDGGYMAIFQVEDLEAERERLTELGVRIVWEASLEDAATLHLHPRDAGGAIVSLDAMRPPASWRWAGPDWRAHVRTDVVRGLVGATLHADDPTALARRWSQVLGVPLAGAETLPLEGGALRFAARTGGAPDGLVGVDLEAVDADAAVAAARRRGLPVRGDATPEVAIGGCWFRAL